MSQEKISEFILKLSLSGLPPSFQEYLLNRIADLSDENITSIIEILDQLAKTETDYLDKAEKFTAFYKKLSEDIKKKLNLETEKIQAELMQELAQSS